MRLRLVSLVYLAGNGIIVRGMRWDGADWLQSAHGWHLRLYNHKPPVVIATWTMYGHVGCQQS